MRILEKFDRIELAKVGQELHRFAADLYPICRSITGEGIQRTLAMIADRVPLQIFEVPTGTPVFDWTVPKEWSVRDAYLAGSDGKRIVDFQKCNLHVVSYSMPVHATMPISELRPHLFTIPEHPDWIPYRTSYYKEDWGLCLSHNQMLALDGEEYEVCIDSSLVDGHLTYGEFYLPGQTTDEVLISCHACHPSLANDNLSGVTVATSLAKFLSAQGLRYSYRFLFIPGTIGAITWLARNKENVGRIRHGLVLTCLGDAGSFHYKKSRQGNAEVDRAAALVLKHEGEPGGVVEFSPYGYDERQYCSPGFQSSRRLSYAKCLGMLPRIPHFGRQPRIYSPGAACRVVSGMSLYRGRAREQSTLPQPESLLRASAWPEEPLLLYRWPCHWNGDKRPPLGAKPIRRRALSTRYRRTIGHLVPAHQ